MNPEDNIQIAKKGYADFGRGDIAAILESLDENIVWSSPDIGIPPGGTYHGKAGVAQFFQHVSERWEFQAFEPKHFVASGDQVVALGSYTATAKATGRQVTADWAMAWTIRDGKVVRFQEYTDSAALRDALTARAIA
jgi:ketosteroid isomerase-like protein